MKKLLSTIAIVLSTSGAFAAQTAVLNPTDTSFSGCSSNALFLNPAVASGPAIGYVSISNIYGRVLVELANGDIYDSGLYAVKNPMSGLNNVVLYDASGKALLISAHLTLVKQVVTARSCNYTYTISGSITVE